MSQPVPYDLHQAPLPAGRVAIEASAGTGKTHTLAGLAAREVVEAGVAVSEILVVTFTRAAAAELRDRVRRGLIDAEAALAHPASAQSGSLAALLADCPPDERELRRLRARAAVAEFDAATITTIHGFATQVLATLGSAAPGDPDATLVDDGRELIDQTVADVLATAALILDEPTSPGPSSTVAPALASVLRAALAEQPDGDPTGLLPTRDRLSAVARSVLGNPGIDLVPEPDVDEVGPLAATRRALVDAVVAGVRRHRRDVGTLAFDEVLTQVRDALAGPEAARVRDALRRRFRVALIDEFQDTDPVQWDIFASLFADAGADDALVLVGDPKQAIYAFRGANVHTYLAAAHQGDVTRHSLGTNWRSDGAVLTGLGALLTGTSFGDPRIEFLPVAPAPHHADRRLTWDDGTPAPGVRLRSATGPTVPRPPPKILKSGKPGKPPKVQADELRRVIAADLAVQVRRLLEHGRLPTEAADGTLGVRPVRPDDIAVLVRSHAHALPVKAALDAHAIPVLVSRAGSVAESPAARQLTLLLHAVARPADVTRARAAALSWFFAWTGHQLDAATDTELATVHRHLQRWAERLAAGSVAAFAASVWADTDVIARRLRGPDGDREVTDLDHLVELLYSATGGQPTSGPALLEVLAELLAREDEAERELVERRIESEARAVQVVTIHGSKGLEWPIVCCPSLHESGKPPSVDNCIYQDPASGRRTIDVAHDIEWESPEHPTHKARKDLAGADHHGEGLRLAYVALTRARHQLLAWWGNHKGAARSPLGALLFARTADGTIDPVRLAEHKPDVPDDVDAVARLAPLVAAGGGTLDVSEVDLLPDPDATDPWHPEAPAAPALTAQVAVLDRRLDRTRHRWSFTAIAARDHLDAHADTETDTTTDVRMDPEDESGGDAGSGDERLGVETTGPSETTAADLEPPDRHLAALDGTTPAQLASVDLPLGGVPGSAAFGTLVHAVLEEVDFTAEDLDAALDGPIAALARWNDWPVDQAVVRAGLRAAIETPLGPLLGGAALRTLGRADRLDELSFELRLGDGDTPPSVAAIGEAVVRHLPPTDPLLPWAQSVADGRFPLTLAGHLTGSIDAVLRVPGPHPGHPHRYVVVDYKTNTLGERGRPLTIDDYLPERLPEAMAHHHYPLQALLYAVALHRYLRWRIPGYEPEHHLGGAAYLFVRGMVGAFTPQVHGHPCGVFAWDMPAALVVELSDLLRGGRSWAR